VLNAQSTLRKTSLVQLLSDAEKHDYNRLIRDTQSSVFLEVQKLFSFFFLNVQQLQVSSLTTAG